MGCGRRRGAGRRGGFTLTEVVVASFLTLTVTSVIYATLQQTLRMSASARHFLSAEELAFDQLWLIYNRPLVFFESINVATNWVEPTPGESVFGDQGLLRCSVTPVSTNYWEIRANVTWPANGLVRPIPNDLWVRRYRTERWMRPFGENDGIDN